MDDPLLSGAAVRPYGRRDARSLHDVHVVPLAVLRCASGDFVASGLRLRTVGRTVRLGAVGVRPIVGMIAFWRALWPVLSASGGRRLVAASVAMVGITVLEGLALLLLVPLLQLLTSADFSATSSVIDLTAELLGRSGGRLAAALAVLVVVVYVAKGLGSIAVLRWATGVAMREEARLVAVLMRTYLGAPLPLYFARNTAEMQRTINGSLRSIFSQAFVAAFSAGADLLGVAVIGVILVASAPLLAVVGIAYFGLVVVVYQRVIHAGVREASLRVHHDQATVFREVQQALHAVKDVKAGAVEQRFVDGVATSRRRMLKAYRTIALLAVQPRYVLELAMVGAATVVSVVAYTTAEPATATASIAVFLAGGFRMLQPLNKVFNGVNQVKTARPAIEQLSEDLREIGPLADEQLRPSPVPAPLEPSVELRSVSFTYDGARQVVDRVSLEVRPGESVALVGGSGAGKSTLVDLLIGLLEPTEGSIVVGGHDLVTVRRSWQRTIAYVPQSITLLDDSVRANVAFGLEVDDDAVWSSLLAAQLDDVVRALPHGLGTRIGERGVRLSGGQRQRLGVARALYRKPRLLVLDEATSALDSETEAQLTAVLASLRGSITTIAIAHRLSTVRGADRLYFLAGGRVVDQGRFDELADRVPEFARLVELSAVTA